MHRLNNNLVVSNVLSDLAKRDRASEYHDNPALWAEEVAGVHLWSKQRDICEAVVHHKDVAVKAGHGVGKSFTIAVLICWWVYTRHPKAYVASTAPSADQVGTIVWREVRRLFEKINERAAEGLIDHGLPGYITSDNEWKLENGVTVGRGRKPPDTREGDMFQGIHDAYVLAIGDEAVGLSEDMIDALNNITSNKQSRRVLICNPTNPASYVGKLFKTKPENWKLMSISVFDSPAFTGEFVPPDVAEKLVDESYVLQKKQEYGENTPRYISRVLGEFAFDVYNSLFTDSEIATAYDTKIYPSSGSLPVLGVDVARFGEDKSVVYSCQEGKLRLEDSWGKTAATDTARKIHQIALDTGAKEVRIDAAGFGGAVCDLVVEYSGGRYQVVEMLGNAKSPNPLEWSNARAWWFDNLKRMMLDGKIDLDLQDQTLVDELMNIEYKFNNNSALQIESKDDMKKRGVKSPDYADAAVYATANLDYWLGIPYKKGDKVYLKDDDPLLGLDEKSWDNALRW